MLPCASLRTCICIPFFRAFAVGGTRDICSPSSSLDMGHVAPRAPLRSACVNIRPTCFAPPRTLGSPRNPRSPLHMWTLTLFSISWLLDFVRFRSFILLSDWHAFIYAAHYAFSSTSLPFHMERYLFSSIHHIPRRVLDSHIGDHLERNRRRRRKRF